MHCSKPLACVVSALLIGMAGASAATFANLHSFTGGADGGHPYGGLVLSSNLLYGTTTADGSGGNGGVFGISPDGNVFTNIYSFSAGTAVSLPIPFGTSVTNDDGAQPYDTLCAANGFLYGTTFTGGAQGYGTIFKIGQGNFSVIRSFTNGDGAFPYAGVTVSDQRIYGTTVLGGANNSGTVFTIGDDGSTYTNIESFGGAQLAFGYNPYGGVTLHGNKLYGTDFSGGSGNPPPGTFYQLTPDGSSYDLYGFSFNNGDSANGEQPYSSLIVGANGAYGTALAGGTGGNGNGTVFYASLSTGISPVYSFSTYPTAFHTNSDGAEPYGGLIIAGRTLYGTTVNGGLHGYGTVYGVNTDGTGFTNLYNFTGGSDGANPCGTLYYVSNCLYGTTANGGTNGQGTVFALRGVVPATVAFSIQYVTNIEVVSGMMSFSFTNGAALTWNDPSMTVQGATNVSGPYSNLPPNSAYLYPTSPYTNIATSSAGFYELVR
jgi:uncharacterized repeat protein (TIGR03803 family)